MASLFCGVRKLSRIGLRFGESLFGIGPRFVNRSGAVGSRVGDIEELGLHARRWIGPVDRDLFDLAPESLSRGGCSDRLPQAVVQLCQTLRVNEIDAAA